MSSNGGDEKDPDGDVFLIAELCGRQLIGVCEKDDVGRPVEDSRGLVTIVGPLEVRTTAKPVVNPKTGVREEGMALQTDLRPLTNLQWDESIDVRVSSSRIAQPRLDQLYRQEFRVYRAMYVQAIEEARKASGIVTAREVSEDDVSAAAALRNIRTKH